MNRDEVMQLLRAFESEHLKEPIEWRGVDFWPLIRPFLGMELHKTVPFEGLIKPPASLWSRRAGVVRRLLMRLGIYRRWVGDLERQRGNALLVSYVSRQRKSHGRPFHRMATPLAAFLEESGAPLSVWDFDVAPFRNPTAIPTQGIIQWRWMFSAERRRSTPPSAWFPALREFLAAPPVSAPEPLLEWSFWQGLLGSVLFRADQYAAWLGKMQPQVVFVDCWYTSEVLPVILAAKRLGLPTVDLQHGIQGASHFGYAAWPDLRKPAFVPGVFWLWGERDRAVLEENGNALGRQARAVVGGCLELNFTRERSGAENRSSDRAAPPARIVVTEQKGIDVAGVLKPVIEATAETRQWVIRPHPGQERSALEAALGAAASRVTIVPPDRETVYETLAGADVHVTGFSSVALEALALGQRTLLVHPAAREIYGPFIEQGVMTLALDAEALREALEQPDPTSPGQFEAAARDTFATVETTREELRKLLEAP